MRLRALTLLPPLLLLLAAARARAEDEDPPASPLAAALAEVRDASPDARDAAAARALLLAPTAQEVVETIRAGLPRRPSAPGWHELSAVDATGTARPYHLYVPQAVAEANRPAPLLVDLHGGVARPEFIDGASFAARRALWQETADERGFLLAAPLGRSDCAWWSDDGVAHVRAVVRDVVRHAPVDMDRVVGTGFSDGASGCWYLALAAPDPFAALVPMNGHPLVAVRASQRELFLRNALAMPLFVCMTQDDGLYPAQTVLPHVEALVREGGAVHLVSYPAGGHAPAYFDEQRAALGGFVAGAVRDPQPERLEWATAHAETSAARWVEVVEIGPAAGDLSADAVPDLQVMSVPGRVVIGIGIDQQFEGPGVRVTTVDARRPAGDLGLRPRDVIVAIDDAAVADAADLRRALGGKRFGERLRVRVLREGEDAPLHLSTEIPPFTSEPCYSREAPFAWVLVEREGNAVEVSSRGARRLRLHLSDTAFDLAAPVVVTVNGVERFRAVPQPDLERTLRDWAAHADPGRLAPATIDVVVPAPER